MDKTTTTPKRRKRLVVLAVAGLAVVSMTAGASSLALFTDTETDASTFTTGTIVLDAGKIAAFNLTDLTLMPGDTVAGSVDVENDGTNQLRYSVDTSTTSVAGPQGGVLNTALLVTVKTIGTSCAAFDGTTLNTDGANEVLGSSNVLFGNPAANDGTGDRTVNAGATDVLCFRVSLPGATGNAFQGATATSTFTFNAEQTENN